MGTRARWDAGGRAVLAGVEARLAVGVGALALGFIGVRRDGRALGVGALARRGLHHGSVAVGRGQRQCEEQGEIAGHHLSCDRWAGLLVIWVISLPNKAARCLGSKQDKNSNGEIIVP